MRQAGSVLVGLVVGLGLGTALALALRRTRGHDGVDLVRLQGLLEVQAAELRRLADGTGGRDLAADRVQAEVAGARRALEQLAIRDEERARREREAADVVRRLSTVLAGGSAVGRAGENVLREQLAQLPPGMLVTDLHVNGKVVEFALDLPDGRRLPVDSKWAAVAELEALEAAEDAAEREALARAVERIVAGRCREVASYLDPSLTAPVAVAAVPDAAYAVLRRAHADAFARNVVVVPYSTALPVLLFLHSLVARYGNAGDLHACLSEVATLLEAMEGVLENKVARGATMVANGADELRAQSGKARASIAATRAAPSSGRAPQAGSPPGTSLAVVP